MITLTEIKALDKEINSIINSIQSRGRTSEKLEQLKKSIGLKGYKALRGNGFIRFYHGAPYGTSFLLKIIMGKK